MITEQDFFQECDTCAAKPGTPPLCQGCLRNRQVIERLLTEITKLRRSALYNRVMAGLPE